MSSSGPARSAAGTATCVRNASQHFLVALALRHEDRCGVEDRERRPGRPRCRGRTACRVNGPGHGWCTPTAVSQLRLGALVSCLAPRGPLFVHVGFFFCATCSCTDADLYVHVHDIKKIVRDTKGAKSSVCGWLGSAPQKIKIWLASNDTHMLRYAYQR